MRASVTFADSGPDRVTMTTDAPEITETDTTGPATPAAVLLVTVMALFESRGLELLGHYVLKALEEGKKPSDVLTAVLGKLDAPNT